MAGADRSAADLLFAFNKRMVGRGTLSRLLRNQLPTGTKDGDRCPQEHQGPVMPVSELPPSAAPALSVACHTCSHEMKLIYIAPDGECIVYAYRCTNGHRHEVVATFK